MARSSLAAFAVVVLLVALQVANAVPTPPTLPSMFRLSGTATVSSSAFKPTLTIQFNGPAQKRRVDAVVFGKTVMSEVDSVSEGLSYQYIFGKGCTMRSVSNWQDLPSVVARAVWSGTETVNGKACNKWTDNDASVNVQSTFYTDVTSGALVRMVEVTQEDGKPVTSTIDVASFQAIDAFDASTFTVSPSWGCKSTASLAALRLAVAPQAPPSVPSFSPKFTMSGTVTGTNGPTFSTASFDVAMDSPAKSARLQYAIMGGPILGLILRVDLSVYTMQLASNTCETNQLNTMMSSLFNLNLLFQFATFVDSETVDGVVMNKYTLSVADATATVYVDASQLVVKKIVTGEMTVTVTAYKAVDAFNTDVFAVDPKWQCKAAKPGMVLRHLFATA